MGAVGLICKWLCRIGMASLWLWQQESAAASKLWRLGSVDDNPRAFGMDVLSKHRRIVILVEALRSLKVSGLDDGDGD